MHFDGAVNLYDKANYGGRFNTDPRRRIKAAERRKLFRLDGEIDLATWGELTTRFFYNNELVEEYLNSAL